MHSSQQWMGSCREDVMVFRLFVFLMFANVMVAATKAQAGQQDDFLQVDRQVAPGVIQPYQAGGDLASSKIVFAEWFL